MLRRAAAHWHHDFRHTFAVKKYFDEVNNQKAEPWLLIKELLRQASVETTRDIPEGGDGRGKSTDRQVLLSRATARWRKRKLMPPFKCVQPKDWSKQECATSLA